MADPAAVIQATTNVQLELQKLWGFAPLGLHLVQAFYSNQPLSTDELAARCEVSAETIRRHLKPLWNIGRVETIRDGRNVSYIAAQQWAEHTARMIEGEALGAGYSNFREDEPQK